MTAYLPPKLLPRRRFLGQSLGLVASHGLSTIAIAQALTPPANLRLATGPTPFPDASTTGVPLGTSLTNSGAIQTTSNGQVIQNLNITGGINVRHANVTIRRCKVTGVSGWAVIQTSNGAENTLVEDCEIDGGRVLGSYGIGVSGVVRRCKVHGVENGLNPQSNSLYEDNYVYGLNPIGADPHSDGIPIQGGPRNVTLRHNTVDISGSTGFNATVFLNGYFGPLDNIVFDQNLMIGVGTGSWGNQGFNIYCYTTPTWGAVTNIRFTNNVIQPATWGVFFDASNGKAAAGSYNVLTEWTNNINYNTGALIPKPV